MLGWEVGGDDLAIMLGLEVGANEGIVLGLEVDDIILGL
jgi:hypothetical protein